MMDALWPHVLILNAAIVGWAEYIQSLSDQLQSLVRHTIFNLKRSDGY